MSRRAVAPFALILAACSSGSETGGTTAVLVRAGEGGIVVSADRTFALEVPKNALAADTEISVRAVDPGAVPAEVAALEPRSPVYELLPEGLTFTGTQAWAYFAPRDVPAGVVDGDRTVVLGALSRSAGGKLEEWPWSLASVRGGKLWLSGRLDHLSLQFFSAKNTSTEWETECCDGAVLTVDTGPHPVGQRFTGRASFEIFFHPRIDERNTNEQYRFEGSAFVEVYYFHVAGSAAEVAQGQGPLAPLYRSEDQPFGSGLVDLNPSRNILGVRVAAPTHHGGRNVFELTPSPAWVCVRPGPGTIGVLVVKGLKGNTYTPDGSGGTRIGVVRQIKGVEVYADVTCAEGPPNTDPPVRESVMADITRMTVTFDAGGVPRSTLAPPTAGGNVVMAADREKARTLREGVILLEGFDPKSTTDGPERIDVSSRVNGFRAQRDASTARYQISGLRAGPAFDANDTVEFKATPPGGNAEVSVRVQANLPAASTAHFGPISGLATEVRLPSGSFDLFYEVLKLAGGPASGETALRIAIPAASLPEQNGMRVRKILEEPERAQLAQMGYTVERIQVGGARVVEDNRFFPARPAMQFLAARLYQLDPAELSPPQAGAAVVRDCSALPADFPRNDPNTAGVAVVCIPAGGQCRVTNDTYEDQPPVPAECYGEARAVTMGMGGFVCEGRSMVWRIVSASFPYQTGCGTAPAGQDHMLVVERIAGGARYEVRFRNTGSTTYRVLSVTAL